MQYFKGDRVQYKPDINMVGTIIRITNRVTLPNQNEFLYEIKWDKLENSCMHVAVDIRLIKRKEDITAEEKYGYLFLEA
jgi:hypothetical protein